MSEWRPIKDGDVIARVPLPPCRCGGTTWEALADDTRCAECGLVYFNEQETERVKTAEGIVRVHRSVRVALDDPEDRHEMFSWTTGRDDQRPDHDPDAGVYRPICVAQHLSKDSDAIYTYLTYCGSCRHNLGSLANDAVYCPYCAVTLGNYVFSDGIEHWYPENWTDRPPKVWGEE